MFPQRIISLVPSQTELLYDLGMDGRVVGITKFCVHPEAWFRSITRIGGTKTLDIEKILSLEPDLIIANREENVREQVEALAAHVPVWVTDVSNLDEAVEMIREMGDRLGAAEKADSIAKEIILGFLRLSSYRKTISTEIRAAYLIWKNPYMSVGGDTFISDMLSRCGIINVLASETRYPQVSIEQLRELRPDVVLLSSEPYPFKDKHLLELEEELPGVKAVLVDGELFSWFGSRLRRSPEYFRQLLEKLAGAPGFRKNAWGEI